jgi:hypothetical protein
VDFYRIGVNKPAFACFNEGNAVGSGSLTCDQCQFTGGWAGGVTATQPITKVCRNVTTGQRVTIQNRKTTWSCTAAGLIVNPGDRIQQIITGTAP